MKQVKIAKVIVDVPATSINQTFDYLIPEQFEEILQTGMRVVIPFGPRKITGFVVAKTSESEFEQLKEIIDVLDLTPVLTPELLELGKWLANDTLCLYIVAFQAMLPQVLKAKYDKEIVRLTSSELSSDLENLFAGRKVVPYETLTDKEIS